MKDKWMNVGYEGDDLLPHIEPVEDYNITSRIGGSWKDTEMQYKAQHAKRRLLSQTFVQSNESNGFG